MHSYTLMFFEMIIISLCIMPFIMINKPSDWYLSLNQVYGAISMGLIMILLDSIICGKYFSIMQYIFLLIGLTFTIYCIRNQTFINDVQYIRDMIPHHSMAVLTSKYHINNNIDNSTVQKLADTILTTQEKEIHIMKKLLKAI